MKKIVSLLTLIFLFLSLTTVSFASQLPFYGDWPGDHQQYELWKQSLTKAQLMQLRNRAVRDRIRINGYQLEYDVPPVIHEGRTLVPLRAIANGLKAEVDWNEVTKVITITRDDIVIKLELGSTEFTVNGVKYELDVPARLISNRTFVPLRFIAQALGDRVSYDPDTGDIDIYGPLDTPEPPTLVNFIAKWQAVEYENNGYRLRLFLDGTEVRVVTLAHGAALQYDFEEDMDEPGSYTVRVTALATGELKNSKESRPSDPQIVGVIEDLEKFTGTIDGLSVSAKEITILYSKDGQEYTKILKVLLSTDIEIDQVDADLEDLHLGDQVTVTLFRDTLIILEVDR